MSRTQKPIDRNHPDWKSTVNDLREKQINDYKKSLRSVMKDGYDSTGTKFASDGKIIGSKGIGPTTKNNRTRRMLRETLASQLDAKTANQQFEKAVNVFQPNVRPLDVETVIRNKEKKMMDIEKAEIRQREYLEGQRAMATVQREEANKPKDIDVGEDAVSDENREGQGSYGKGRAGGRKTRRRHRNKSQRKKSHKKKSHKKKSQRKKSHKKSKRHRRH